MLSNFLQRFGPMFPKSSNILVWVIGLVLLFGAALHELLPLLDQYQHNNTATQIRVIANDTLRPPAVTLCVPWSRQKLDKVAEHLLAISKNETNTVCLECDRLKKHQWDVWTYGEYTNTSTKDEFKQRLATDFVAHLLYAGDMGFRVLDMQNSDWNQPVLDAAWEYFWCIKELDAHTDTYDDNAPRPWCFSDQLADQMLTNKSVIDKLYDKLIEILCNYVSFQSASKSNPFTNLIEMRTCFKRVHEVRSVVMKEHFCFEVTPTRDDGGSSVKVSAFKVGNGIRQALNEAEYYLIPNTDILSEPPETLANSDTLYVTRAMEEQVNIRYEVVIMVKEKRDVTCYEEPSPRICKSDCWLRKISTSCHCVPFTFRHQAIGQKTAQVYCNTSNYDSCDFDKKSAIGQCQQECKYPCEYVSYRWHTTQVKSVNGQRWRTFTMIMLPISATYIEFGVTLKTTWPQFISQIGAICNLYLGFSGLTVIAFAMFCGRFCRRWYVSRNEKSISASPRHSVASIGFRQIQPDPMLVLEISELKSRFQALETVCDGFRGDISELKTDLSEFRRILKIGFMKREKLRREFRKVCDSIDYDKC